MADGDAEDELHLEFVSGVHGQELIEARAAAPVLPACGRTLRRIHRLDVAEVLPGVPHPSAAVLVHGDYGPNNLLLDPGTFAVTAVLDWEWTHPGRAVEDLAWCEWIVRMHHSAHVPVLATFFDAYGARPSWQDRQAEMVARCEHLMDVSRRSHAESAHGWRQRLEVTAGWVE